MLEVARQSLLQLEPLQVGELHAHAAGDRLGEAFAQEDERLVQAVGLDRIRPEPLRQAAVEAVERLVRDSAANARVEDGVDLLRVDDALEEPHRGAIEEALELRDREAGALGELLDDERMGKRRLAVEGGEGALDAPLPAVRQRERAGLVLVRRGDRGRRAQAFALGRAALELPGETREGTLLRRERNVGRVEPRAHLFVEGTRLVRTTVVVGGLANEDELAPGARARRVEEVALAREGIRPYQSATLAAGLELAPSFVGKERCLGGAPREDPFFQPENEDGLPPPRAGAHEVDDSHPPRLGGAPDPYLGALERRDDLLRRRLAAELAPAFELVEQAQRSLVCAQVDPRPLADGRRLEPVGGRDHPPDHRTCRCKRVGLVTELSKSGNGVAEEPLGLLDDARRILDRPPAEPALDEVRFAAGEARVRRAQVREEVSPTSAEPGEAEQPEKRAAEGRAPERNPALVRVRDAQRSESRLEGRADAVEGRDDDGDLVSGHSAPDQRQDFLARELERGACTGGLEETHRALDRGRVGAPFLEERALEVGKRGARIPLLRGKRLDGAGEAREIVRGALK